VKRTEEQNGHREPNGRWKKGVIPEGAKPFPPGVSGNPEGRPTAGATIREWWNVMQGWTMEQLAACLSDPLTPLAKRTAAAQWLGAFEGNGTAVDRICDRTEGKPTQNVNVNGEVAHRVESQAKVRKVLNDPAAVDAAGILADRLYGDGEPNPN
jgi:hypothetical protein